MFIFPHNLVAIDLETTDIDPVKGSIVQIGAIKLNKQFEIEDEFQTYIMPLDGHFSPEAQKVNKITIELLKENNAPDLNNALGKFELFCHDCTHLGAWAANFDITFLEEQYKKINRKFIFSHRQFDMRPIAMWEMAKIGKSIAYRIDMFLQLLGKKFQGGKHDALNDVRNAIYILQNFRDKYYDTNE